MAKRGGPRNPGGKLLLPNGPALPIPDKLYFRIGEAARLCRVPAYVLRFWQTEFPQLRPGKSGTGQRLYRRRDVEMALRIKSLLHEEGYTIAGAKAVLAAESAVPPSMRLSLPAPVQPDPPLEPHSSQPVIAVATETIPLAELETIRSGLRDLLHLLR